MTDAPPPATIVQMLPYWLSIVSFSDDPDCHIWVFYLFQNKKRTFRKLCYQQNFQNSEKTQVPWRLTRQCSAPRAVRRDQMAPEISPHPTGGSTSTRHTLN